VVIDDVVAIVVSSTIIILMMIVIFIIIFGLTAPIRERCGVPSRPVWCRAT